MRMMQPIDILHILFHHCINSAEYRRETHTGFCCTDCHITGFPFKVQNIRNIMFSQTRASGHIEGVLHYLKGENGVVFIKS